MLNISACVARVLSLLEAPARLLPVWSIDGLVRLRVAQAFALAAVRFRIIRDGLGIHKSLLLVASRHSRFALQCGKVLLTRPLRGL